MDFLHVTYDELLRGDLVFVTGLDRDDIHVHLGQVLDRMATRTTTSGSILATEQTRILESLS